MSNTCPPNYIKVEFEFFQYSISSNTLEQVEEIVEKIKTRQEYVEMESLVFKSNICTEPNLQRMYVNYPAVLCSSSYLPYQLFA